MLPAALKAWRRERSMSQSDLATSAQCSEGLVAQIETGRRQPGLVNAIAIAKALSVPLDAIALVHVATDDLISRQAEAVA